jgi:hypothetical protein
MKPIIQPIASDVLLGELTVDKCLRKTNYLKNEIYVFNGNDSPNLMLEVGRLRELSFRSAGGGTGKEIDVDEYDYGPYAYMQLIVWNPEQKEMTGGYRYKPCWQAIDAHGKYHLSSTEIFEYSDRLKSVYFPKTIELGRSFVQPNYQASQNPRQGAYALDNLWDGLGALTKKYDVAYFFGKMTMYTHFNTMARDLILGFLAHFFPDNEGLIRIPSRLEPANDISDFLENIKNLNYKEAHRLLTSRVRDLGESVPPLFNAYMNLSSTMKSFGTSVNQHFGGVEETGILIKIEDIFEEKKKRYIDSF